MGMVRLFPFHGFLCFWFTFHGSRIGGWGLRFIVRVCFCVFCLCRVSVVPLFPFHGFLKFLFTFHGSGIGGWRLRFMVRVVCVLFFV